MSIVDQVTKLDNPDIDESKDDRIEEIEGITDDELNFLLERMASGKSHEDLPDNKFIEKRLNSDKEFSLLEAGYDGILRGWYGQLNKPRWCPKQSKFGAIRPGKRHGGVDIAALKGSPLRSLVNGSLEWKPNGGNIGHRVWINFRYRGSNYTLIYGHLDGKIGSAPRRVRAGEEVARVGCSGNTTYCPNENCVGRREDHVHVQIVGPNGLIDPVSFVGWNLQYYNDTDCYYLRCP